MESGWLLIFLLFAEFVMESGWLLILLLFAESVLFGQFYAKLDWPVAAIFSISTLTS